MHATLNDLKSELYEQIQDISKSSQQKRRTKNDLKTKAQLKNLNRICSASTTSTLSHSHADSSPLSSAIKQTKKTVRNSINSKHSRSATFT